jgi:hypothetical protein
MSEIRMSIRFRRPINILATLFLASGTAQASEWIASERLAGRLRVPRTTGK